MQYIWIIFFLIIIIIISLSTLIIKSREKFWMNPSRTVKVERIIRYPDGREYSIMPNYGKMLDSIKTLS